MSAGRDAQRDDVASGAVNYGNSFNSEGTLRQDESLNRATLALAQRASAVTDEGVRRLGRQRGRSGVGVNTPGLLGEADPERQA
jgi:hypothetical protein